MFIAATLPPNAYSGRSRIGQGGNMARLIPLAEYADAIDAKKPHTVMNALKRLEAMGRIKRVDRGAKRSPAYFPVLLHRGRCSGLLVSRGTWKRYAAKRHTRKAGMPQNGIRYAAKRHRFTP